MLAHYISIYLAIDVVDILLDALLNSLVDIRNAVMYRANIQHPSGIAGPVVFGKLS